MVQLCSQKYKRMFSEFLLSYISSSQIWLNILVDKHFGYIKKLKKKNLLGNVLDYDQEV
jgi:hypothetical protein